MAARFRILLLALFALSSGSTAHAQNDLGFLNDEFEDSATLGNWQERWIAEGWSADQLELWDIDASQPGRMVMMPYTVTWYGNYEGPLVFKRLGGDFAITTQVHATNRAGAGAPSRDYSLAGIMIRRPRTDDASTWTQGHEAYVFLSLGRGIAPGWQYEVKTTVNSASTLELSPAPGADATLQTARIGDAVITLRREPSQPWVVHRRYHRTDLPETLQVGLVSYTDWPNVSGLDPYVHNSTVLNGTPDLLASFEYARFFRPVVPPELAGLDLSNPVEVTDAQLLSFLGDAADDPVAVGGTRPPARIAIAVIPNPSRAAVRFEIRLPDAGAVRVGIHDVTGRRVATVDAGNHPAGGLTLRWDGRDASGMRVPAGIYLARVATPHGAASARLCVIE